MSFSGDVKIEMSRISVQKPCCALAELYGIFLFASAFGAKEIRIITSNEKLHRRIAQLCAMQTPPLKADFEVSAASGGRMTLTLSKPQQIAGILKVLGYDESGFLTLHFKRMDCGIGLLPVRLSARRFPDGRLPRGP